MSSNTLTLALEGDVRLAAFREAIASFEQLVNKLTAEVADSAKIDWIVEDLQAGSALATIVGKAETDEPVLRVISAYEEIGKSLQERKVIPFSVAVQKEVEKLTKTIRGDITALRLETSQAEYTIYSGETLSQSASPNVRAWGIVSGRVQALNSRNTMRFTLYDSIFDKAVSCYLREDQAEIMLDVWGKNVQVAGYVTRDPSNGRAVNIRQITSVEVVQPSLAGNYRVARGVLAPAIEPAEVSIRRIRDADD